MALVAVTVLGHDGPGIIASVTRVLADLGGNLEDSSMTLLRGHFAMTLIVDADVSPTDVEAALLPVTEPRGLVVSARLLPAEGTDVPRGTHHLLTVHGSDRPGIVSAITELLATRGGNVTDLTTRLAGHFYVLVAEVDLPEGTEADVLARELAEIASQLGVEASLRAAEADLL
ncbi:MAG: glycine cleavage system transcriptional repressor [Frankiales bacterium]|jgi:glycine cleavage system transcriptional repressor|nr:glycine cleavage system transcriptional repressor [Frankiales bacterium]